MFSGRLGGSAFLRPGAGCKIRTALAASRRYERIQLGVRNGLNYLHRNGARITIQQPQSLHGDSPALRGWMFGSGEKSGGAAEPRLVNREAGADLIPDGDDGPIVTPGVIFRAIEV